MKGTRSSEWVLVVLVSIAIAGSGRASAQEESGVVVLFMSDTSEGVARSGALAVELAPRGARVVSSAPPPGRTHAARAETALGAARANAADVALWIEAESDGSLSIRARAAARDLTAWAPLPSDATDPRVVALIAASIIDELLAVPTSEPVSVSIRARVQLAAPAEVPVPMTSPVPVSSSAAPGTRQAALVPPRDALAVPDEPVAQGPRQRRDFYLELGFMTAGIANGGVVSAGFYPHHFVRLDLAARLVHVALNDSFASAYTVSGSFVTDDDDGRFEIGLAAGVVVVTSSTTGGLGRPICVEPCASGTIAEAGFVGGLHAGFSWGPWPDVRVGFRAHLDVSVVENTVSPAPLGDLYVQVMP